VATMLQRLVCFASVLLAAFRDAHAYIPALPTNNTSALQDTMDATTPSMLHLQWFSDGFAV
jgi:hypothetical protein